MRLIVALILGILITDCLPGGVHFVRYFRGICELCNQHEIFKSEIFESENVNGKTKMYFWKVWEAKPPNTLHFKKFGKKSKGEKCEWENQHVIFQ